MPERTGSGRHPTALPRLRTRLGHGPLGSKPSVRVGICICSDPSDPVVCADKRVLARRRQTRPVGVVAPAAATCPEHRASLRERARARLPPRSVLRFCTAGFVIDRDRRAISRDGQPVVVQKRVFDLILYLVEHRTRAVSKAELLEKVWHDVAVSEASVNQCVRSARLALGDAGEEPGIIRTQRGFGFIWVAEVEVEEPAKPEEPAADDTFTSLPAELSEMTATETAKEVREIFGTFAPHLFLVLRCDQPLLETGGFCLEGVDEVVIMRSREPHAKMHEEPQRRRLILGIPGASVSRYHARLARSQSSWVLRDENSRNGTFVNGRLVQRHELLDGDVIDCGNTLFRFRATLSSAPRADAAPTMVQAGTTLSSALGHVGAELSALERFFEVSQAVLLTGEPGTEAEPLARALHMASSRGRFLPLEAHTLQNLAELPGEGPATVFVEDLMELSDAGQLALREWLEQQLAGCRLIAATHRSEAELAARGFRHDLLNRLVGQVHKLTPLRGRLEDLGAYVRQALEELDAREARLAPEVGLALLAHPWPGNLVELRQALAAAWALKPPDGLIRREELPPALLHASG